MARPNKSRKQKVPAWYWWALVIFATALFYRMIWNSLGVHMWLD